MYPKMVRFLRPLFSILILLVLVPFPAHAVGIAERGPASPATEKGLAHPANAGANDLEIQADAYGVTLANDATAGQYQKPSVLLKKGDRVQFDAEIKQEGDYQIFFDMASAESYMSPPEGSLLIDGALASADAPQIVFPLFYQNSAAQFPLDRYGNEALIKQQRLIQWSEVPLRDVNFSQKYPLQIHLSRGKHTFTFSDTQESLYLGSMYLREFVEPPTYEQYLQDNQAAEPSGVLITLEAEYPTYKNDTSVRPVSDRSLDVTPYDTYRLLLNTLGGDSWKRSGSTVYYKFDVPEDGMYLITLRAIQNFKNNFTVFRRITLNGSVLFRELNSYGFNYSTSWQNITLGGDTPYKVFMKKGENVLGIEAVDSPYYSAIQKIKKVLVDINNLALQIKKLTGNQIDRYKEWVITDYIPDIKEQLIAIADDLQVDLDVLKQINDQNGSQEILSYQMAIDNIHFLANDPDKVPIYMNRFSEGSGSAAQLLGSLLTTLQEQPLALDKIYIHSVDQSPKSNDIPFYTYWWEDMLRFFNSFAPDPYQTIGSGEDEIEVWVNRPRQYVDLLQTMTDQSFTMDTGIKVKFSIMPDEAKLVLANAAGIQPDVALGVSTNVPYELAIRNALKDLRTFKDFDSFIRIYSPGALLSYVINDSVYAIPETQDFWVTFYRKDIMDSLGLPIPTTWDEVIEILPELQRYSMNFNTPLSTGAGMKGYLATAPYIFNYGAQLYSPDGFSTGLESEEAIKAITFMAESFTVYGMPLTTANFYDSFRYGSVPIGVSNFTDYLKLFTAAPELNGLWGISLYPATVLPDGRKLRYATGSAQACIMFANTEKPDESWQFMKWWMSTETQIEFQQQIVLNYGIEYLWNSANVEAFSYLPIPEEDKQVILEQWQWLQEPVRLPGSYMQERELSNAWNRIVFDGVNPRVAIDSAVITINREITRKMEEFGYLKDGQVVKEFKVPTIDTIKRWMEDGQ